MGDLAYDSDPLDRTLKQDYGIGLIAPHKGRTAELCGVIAACGKLNAFSHGCTISDAWSFAGDITKVTSTAWSNLPAL